MWQTDGWTEGEMDRWPPATAAVLRLVKCPVTTV